MFGKFPVTPEELGPMASLGGGMQSTLHTLTEVVFTISLRSLPRWQHQFNSNSTGSTEVEECVSSVLEWHGVTDKMR